MPNASPTSSAAPTTTASSTGSIRTCGVSGLAGAAGVSGLNCSKRPWSSGPEPGQLVVSSGLGGVTVALLTGPGNTPPIRGRSPSGGASAGDPSAGGAPVGGNGGSAGAGTYGWSGRPAMSVVCSLYCSGAKPERAAGALPRPATSVVSSENGAPPRSGPDGRSGPPTPPGGATRALA